MNLLDQFLDHWRSIPKSGPVPRLSDYLDHPHPATQPWTLIIDIEEKHFPTRLFGTGLANMIDVDLTGTDHLLMFPVWQHEDSLRRHKLLVTHPCGMYSKAHAQTRKGMMAEIVGLALPLLRDGGGKCVARIIRVTKSLGYSDQLAKITSVAPEIRWLDLGYGVPDYNEPPVKTS